MLSFPAFNRSVILLSAMLFMAALWGLGHIPDANFQMIVFTCLISALLVDERSFSRRLGMALNWACCSSAVQFIFSISGVSPLLRIIFSLLLSLFIFSVISDFRAGCIVMLTGYLVISTPPGLRPALGRSIDIFIGVVIIMLVTTAGNITREQSPDTAFHPLRYSPYHALLLSAKLGIGTAIAELLPLQQSKWIMLTTLFINMSKSPDVPGAPLALKRIFAVPVGIILGGLLLGTFYRIDDRFIWLLPFIGAGGFFILYNCGNFFLFSIIFMVTLTLFADWRTGVCHRFQFWDSFFSLSTATLLGALPEMFPAPEDEGEKAV